MLTKAVAQTESFIAGSALPGCVPIWLGSLPPSLQGDCDTCETGYLLQYFRWLPPCQSCANLAIFQGNFKWTSDEKFVHHTQHHTSPSHPLIIRHLDTLYGKGSIAQLDAAGVVAFVSFGSSIKLVSVSKWAPFFLPRLNSRICPSWRLDSYYDDV